MPAKISPRVPLDRPTLITAALKLLDEVGLEGLTLRRLAASLGVQAPAIYWHFKHKQDLLDEMASTALISGLRQMPSPGAKWDKWAIVYGRGLRLILLRHRDGAKMISGTRMTDNSFYASVEQSLRIFVDAGFSRYAAVVALSTIYSYAVGFVIEEQAVYPTPDKRLEIYDPEKRSQRVDPEKFPLALKAGEDLFSNFDRRFDDGLKIIVAGLTAKKSPKRSAR